MAEAWTNILKGDRFEAYSAGVDPKGVDPRAVKVMKEVGIDISEQKSKSVDELWDLNVDYVITLCDNAQKSCPVFPATTAVLHAGFDDPPKLAKAARTEEEALDYYRRVRDELKRYVESLSDLLK